MASRHAVTVRWAPCSSADAVRAVLMQQPPPINKLNKTLICIYYLTPAWSSSWSIGYMIWSLLHQQRECGRSSGEAAVSAKTNNLPSHRARLWARAHIRNQPAHSRGKTVGASALLQLLFSMMLLFQTGASCCWPIESPTQFHLIWQV